jgi:hypothetical protein
MDLVTLIAATVAEEEEGSGVPFVVSGLLLAGWAVLVSVYGIRRHKEWPAAKGARQGVVALTALLVAATMAIAALGG